MTERVGAQDVHPAEPGAHTGDVSIEMISSARAQRSATRNGAPGTARPTPTCGSRSARRSSAAEPREPALGVPFLGNQDGPAMVSAAVSS
jgi:triosephosphate isomerase-like protein